MTDPFTNVTGLGYNARVSGSNQLQLGDTATTVYAQSAVQTRSDQRDKADIQETKLGLEFINQLRPVDYRWDVREDYTQYDEEGNATGLAERDGSQKRNRFHHGVIAQEVQKVIEDTGVDFGGFQDHTVAGGSDVMSVGYEEFIAPLIKAVQELSKKVAELEAKQA